MRQQISMNQALFDGVWLRQNWIQFKLYDDPAINRDWRTSLNWYHTTLRTIRPTVESDEAVALVLFTTYGPQDYESSERVIAERSLPSVPNNKVSFIKLRIFPIAGLRERVKGICEERFNTLEGLWNYETFKEYDVLADLGNRYGRDQTGVINRENTLRFMRFWDAGCRYILSIMSESGDWEENVDVWGVPHLINNALGAWLRLPIARCGCGGPVCIATSPVQINPTQVTEVPLFLSCCSKCGKQSLVSTNI